MKKLSLLFALLCVSVMGWAGVAQDTWIASDGGTYDNQFKWYAIDGVNQPTEVVNIQKPAWSEEIGIYTHKDAFNKVTFNGVEKTNGTHYHQDGAGAILFVSALTEENTEVKFYNGDVVLWGLRVYNANAGSGSITPDPTPATQYCRLATGHLGNPEHGDVNGRILVTLRKLSNSSVKVKVEPNNNGNDYFDVMKVELNGASQEMGSAGGPALSNMEFEYTGLASLNFTLNILWHNHNWADVNGRWTTQQFSVTEAELCTEETVLTVGSEYCCYYGDETKSGSHYATLTWETNEEGDVVITIGEGPGEHNTAFRGNGLGNNLDGFHVLSGEGFAIDEESSIYFNRVYGGAGSKTYTLQKKGGVTLPSPAKIRFYGKPFEWLCDENTNAYTENKTFVYTYGTICNQLDAPANVAVSADSVITFDAVAGATKYTAYVYLAGVEKYRQEVVSGDVLHFWPLADGDYHVNVVAWGAGKTASDPSTDYIWSLEERTVVLGNSEYCQTNMSSGNTLVGFTWQTNNDGDIVITLNEVLSGSNPPAHFRGAGMALANFQVGAGKAPASNFFTHPTGDVTGNELILSLIDPANKPALGEKIYYTNHTVEYATSEDTNAWPSLTFEYTYGTVCSGIAVSASSSNTTMGTAVVKKGEDVVTSVEDGDEVQFIATVADAEQYRFVNWTKAGVEVSTNATYVTNITETMNLVANFDYVRNGYCHYEVLSNESAVQGKKLYMTIGAIGGGDYIIKFEGSAEAPFTGLHDANYVINHVTAKTDVDGQPKTGNDVPFTKTNGRWNFDAAGYGKAWIVFSLEDGKTIDDIYVWANAIYFNTASGVLGYVDNNDRLGLFGMNAAHRHNIDWNSTCADTEAPVFAKAEAEVLNETSVQLKIQATDNWGGLLTYTIAREAAEPIISNHASGEEFTQDVTGLTAGTEYTFTVTVSDGVNNTNQNIVVTPVGDVTKPVMVEASLASKTYKSAIINVVATDDKGVTAYYIVENDADYVASEGKITVEGLTAATPYTYTIKAKDAAGNISDNAAEVNFTTDAHELVPTTAAPVPTWPAEQVKSIYSDAYALATVGTPNYNAPWWNAPAINLLDISGDHFMDYDLANDGMIGWQYNQISVVSMEKVHIDIYASAAGTVTIRPITDGDGALNDNRKTLTLAAQEWNSFDVDLAEFGAHDWSKLFQFAIEYWNAGGLTGEHISVDNVYFYRTTPPPADVAAPTDVTVNSTVAKYTSVTIKAQANDDSGVVHFKVLNGSDVLVADVEAVSGAEATIVVNGLAHSTAYNLSLIAYDEASHEAEPVAVAFSTNNAPAAAPVPTHDAKYVLSVYSNAYEPAVAASFNRSNWGSAPLALEEDYLLYSMSANVVVWGNNDGNAGHGNIDGLSGYTHGTTPGLDVSNMQYIHFDVWCDADEQLNTVNINDQAIAIPTTRTIAGQWVSFDVAISSVPLADRQNVRWLKFHPFNAANCNAAIDNVYFWAYGVTPNAAQGTDAGGWATFASPVDLAVPAGLTAYKASYQKTETEEILNLSPISVIPANAGVILKGTAGEAYTFALATEPAPDMSDNVLVGCVTRTDVSAERATKDIFCMRYSGSYDFTGFFLYEGQYVPANRAYLPLDKVSGPNNAPRKVRFVIKNEQTVTDIELTGADTVEATKFIENGQMFIRRGEAVYNLQGVRVK